MAETLSSEKEYSCVIGKKFYEGLKPEAREYPKLEIWAIMCSVGEITYDEKAVQTMYEIVYNQMKLLLHEVKKVALMQIKGLEKQYVEEEITEIVHGDILFLMRQNRVKIKRLLEYLKVMDNVPSCNNAVRIDEEDITSHIPKKNNTRVDQCLQFFAKIEDCNEFTSILKDNIVDVERKRKLQRRELMTQFMTEKEYEVYSNLLPKATFCYQLKQENFKTWLKKINSRMDLSQLAVTILEFLARETIANIVDMAFHIKAIRGHKTTKERNLYYSVSDIKLVSSPVTDKESNEREMPIDAEIVGEGVLSCLKEVCCRNTTDLICEGISNKVFVDASGFSDDFKTFYVSQSKIKKEEIIDAYMQFQNQRKPWLYFADPYLKNPTLICLTSVDDHKIP